MKIISKWKDYYDYFMGIYGMDNTLVYDRRVLPVNRWTESCLDNTVKYHYLYVCNKRYVIFEFKGKLYHTAEEIEKLNLLLKKKGLYKEAILRPRFWYSVMYKLPDGKEVYEAWNKVTDVNKKQRQPIIMGDPDKDENWEIPVLKTYKFYRILPAEVLYQQVEAFISWLKDNPPLPDTQTNEGKIVSHGFDTKTSFRPKMKKKKR